MKNLYTYFKLLFSDDEQLLLRWNQPSNQEKHRQAIARELQKRDYRSDGGNWVKSSA